MKTVIDAADELANALLLRAGLPRVQLARHTRFELLKLLPPDRLVDLYAHVKMLPAPPPHAKMRPLSRRGRAATRERMQSASLGDDLHLCATMCLVDGLDAYSKALADAIGVTAAIERTPQADALIERFRAAMLRCQAPAASRQPSSEGGKKTALQRKREAAKWRDKARKLHAEGETPTEIALKVGKDRSTVSHFLNENPS